jgi:AcrR family transcriptional regulator
MGGTPVTSGSSGLSVTTCVRAKSGAPKAAGRILRAAAHEFSRTGIDGARIGDIARRAGVTKQLVHHYYTTKSELYKAVVDDAAARSVDEMLALDFEQLAPAEALTAFWCQAFDQYAKWPELGAIILDENMHRGEHITARNKNLRLVPLLSAKVARIIRRGQDAKVFKDDVDPAAFFAASVLLVTGPFVQGTTISHLLPFDLTSDEGKAFWRQYSLRLILEMLRR